MKIESLPHQAALKLDSLSLKLTELQTKVEALTATNKVIRDSVKALDRTIIEANIKTSFFTDQLAFQLFCFSVGLILLGFFSWKFILNPFNVKIEEIKKKVIPNLFDQIANKQKEISEESFNANLNSLRNVVIQHMNDDDPRIKSISFIFSIKILILLNKYRSFHNNGIEEHFYTVAYELVKDCLIDNYFIENWDDEIRNSFSILYFSRKEYNKKIKLIENEYFHKVRLFESHPDELDYIDPNNSQSHVLSEEPAN